MSSSGGISTPPLRASAHTVGLGTSSVQEAARAPAQPWRREPCSWELRGQSCVPVTAFPFPGQSSQEARA